MNQDILRDIYQEFNQRICVYDKAILARYCDCSQVERFVLAEREGVNCRCDIAKAQCETFFKMLQHQSRFAMKNFSRQMVLPHTKVLKLQVGGLRGLRAVMVPEYAVAGSIFNVHGVLKAAIELFGSIDELPWPIIIQHIAAFEMKKRRTSINS